jgi:hypothetical protein
MTPDDLPRFALLFDQVAEMYNRPRHSEGVAALLFRALARYPLERIERALGEHLTDPVSGKYMPKPADIVARLEGTPDEAAALAWAAATRAVRTVGAYASVQFSDWRIHAAIAQLGGWTWLCERTEEDLRFVAREFARLYTEAEQHQARSHLAGRAELAALAHSEPAPAPRLVGPTGEPEPTPAAVTVRTLPAPTGELVGSLREAVARMAEGMRA